MMVCESVLSRLLRGEGKKEQQIPTPVGIGLVASLAAEHLPAPQEPNQRGGSREFCLTTLNSTEREKT